MFPTSGIEKIENCESDSLLTKIANPVLESPAVEENKEESPRLSEPLPIGDCEILELLEVIPDCCEAIGNCLGPCCEAIGNCLGAICGGIGGCITTFCDCTQDMDFAERMCCIRVIETTPRCCCGCVACCCVDINKNQNQNAAPHYGPSPVAAAAPYGTPVNTPYGERSGDPDSSEIPMGLPVHQFTNPQSSGVNAPRSMSPPLYLDPNKPMGRQHMS